MEREGEGVQRGVEEEREREGRTDREAEGQRDPKPQTLNAQRSTINAKR
jgi:hypothetical protein